MASLTADNRPPHPDAERGMCRPPLRRPAERRPTRWWLAGLLVGCLLPAGLAQVESLRPVERAAQICILAPALIRASSLLQARRARRRWAYRRLLPRPSRLMATRRRLPPPRRRVAAHDVLTPRGPPSAPCR